MVVCAKCERRMVRQHRKWYQRLGYKQIFQCLECNDKALVPREFISKPSAYVRCPLCHTLKVSRRISRDKIDGMIRTFSSIVQCLLGGRLYHCLYCRIQFYDLRHSLKIQAGSNKLVGKDHPLPEQLACDASRTTTSIVLLSSVTSKAGSQKVRAHNVGLFQ